MKLSFLISASLLCAANAFAATLVHHFTFDGPGITDSVGTTNATLLNGATVTSSKIHFDGIDDYAQFGEHIVPVAGSFSVAFFAQELSPKSYYSEVISQGFSEGPGFYIGYDLAHNFRIGDGIQNTGLPFPSDGLVHHFAITAGSDTRLYVDGSLLAIFGSISMTPSGDHTRLGRQFDVGPNPSEPFHGNLDDLRIYSDILTPTEIANLAVPEPSSAILIAFGTSGLLLRRSNKNQAKSPTP